MEKWKVSAIRANLGLTQKEMADKLVINNKKMALSTYQSKESGKYDWSWKEIQMISELSGVPLEEIYG